MANSITTLIERIVKKYDNLILELQAIDAENKIIVVEINKNSEQPGAKEWAIAARDNLKSLEFALSERNALLELKMRYEV